MQTTKNNETGEVRQEVFEGNTLKDIQARMYNHVRPNETVIEQWELTQAEFNSYNKKREKDRKAKQKQHMNNAKNIK